MRTHTQSIRVVWTMVAFFVALVLVSAGAEDARQTSPPQTRQEQIGAAPRPFDTRPGRLRYSSERYRRLALAAAEGLDYVPGEVRVKFREGVSATAQVEALAALPDRSSGRGLRWVRDVAVVPIDPTADPRVRADELERDPDVLWAEPNYLARLPRVAGSSSAPLTAGARPNAVPNDPEYASRQWNFNAIGLPKAWDISPGGDSSIIVAVIDAGVTTETRTMTFPLWDGSALVPRDIPFAVNTDMAASRFVKPLDLVFFDAGGPVLDMDGHGTHVASTIAEDTNNGFGLAGIAYNVRIMPVKVCYGYWELMFWNGLDGIPGYEDTEDGNCPFDAIEEAIYYAAENGAKVINISLGGINPSSAVRAAIAYAVERGVFISMSGGNRGDNGNTVSYPASYATQFGGAMAVGAVNRSLAKPPYSTAASYIEIAAPGGSSLDGGSSGLVWQSTLREADVLNFFGVPRFDRYESTGIAGTSMAAPHVAGLAALLMSRGITNPSVVETIIKDTARDLGTPGRDDSFGYGLIQARDALFGRGIR